MTFCSQSDTFHPHMSFVYEYFFFYRFLFMLLALMGLSWEAVNPTMCAVIAWRQILIVTGDSAQANMLLFMRMGVWQQIILMPLFLSFKVMMEFTNPCSHVSEHALHFLQSKSTQLKGKDKGKKKQLAQSPCANVQWNIFHFYNSSETTNS